MPKEIFKPVTEADLNPTPEEVKNLVTGAQKYLPPEDEDGEPIETSKDHANKP